MPLEKLQKLIDKKALYYLQSEQAMNDTQDLTEANRLERRCAAILAEIEILEEIQNFINTQNQNFQNEKNQILKNYKWVYDQWNFELNQTTWAHQQIERLLYEHQPEESKQFDKDYNELISVGLSPIESTTTLLKYSGE